MQFSALNSDSNLERNHEEHPSPSEAVSSTREAIESEAFKSYYRGLSLQQGGQLEEARAVLTSVLGSAYLTISLQETGKKIPNELLRGKAARLKLASLRNLSCIAEELESWRECMTCCGQALDIDDTDAMLWCRLGRVSLRVLELELSAYALYQTLSRAPYLTPARKSLISVLYAIYRYDECLLQCSELLRVCPLSQLGADYANWILKSLLTDPLDTRPIDSLRQKLDAVSSADLEASPHLRHGNELRQKQKAAYPVNPPLEEWSPLSRLSSLCWTDLGGYLLSAFREAEAAGATLRPCRLLGADGAPCREEGGGPRGEEAERKAGKRRGPDPLEEMPSFKRRSLRSSQQDTRDSEVLNRNLSDLVSSFFVPRWDYFQRPRCMSEHPSRPKKLSPPAVDPKLLLRSVSSVEGEEERVRQFLCSHNLSPVCSLLLRYLETSSQLFMLSWSHSPTHRLHTVISQMYLVCHGRFMSLPNLPSDSSLLSEQLDTAYVVLMFIEVMVHLYASSHSEEDPLLSQKVLEAAHFLEQVCYSPALPPRHWYAFFLRSSWSLSLLSQHRGLSDKQLSLLDHALQASELYNLQQEAVLAQDSQSDSSSNLDGFSLEYPPDELTLLHPNTHTVINRSLLQAAANKAMTANSLDRGILFHYYLKGDAQLLIDSIKPFVADSPSLSFGFLLVPMQMTSETDTKPNLLQVALECIVSSQIEDSEVVPLLNKILSKLVLSISDSLDVTSDFSELETELVTLCDVIEAFVCKHRQSVLTLIDSADCVGFIWSLLKILQFYWDMRASPMRKLLPISPTVTLLFTCIQKHTQSADCATEESIHGVSSVSESLSESTERRALLAQRSLIRANPALAFLYECHELFAGDRLCCSHQAMLLHLLLAETSGALAALGAGDSCLRELLESELTQILFCLFGYPAKRSRALGLSEHRESDEFFPSFHWPSCYIMLSNLFPASLPTFDDNYSTGISPDLTILCKRLADQLPYREYTVITQEALEAFVQSEADSFPEEFEARLCSHEAECLAMAYYVIADDFLKSHSNKAVEFYTRHLLFYPTHPDSWAGLTLAYFRKLKYMLADRTVADGSLYVSEVRGCMECVSRCFRQANRLYPSHSQLLERYGHFCFQVNSFWQHSCAGELSPPDTLPELRTSLSVFQKALDFDTHIAEPWLYHYLLAKIKWKLLRPLEQCFSHLLSSARILRSDGACYPEHVDCNSARSAIQAIEVHYVIHSMFVKSLFRDKMAAVSGVEAALISLQEASPLSRATFPDTSVTQCIREKRESILQVLGIHQDLAWHHSLEERFISALVESIHGLLVCLARFPSHYKSHYRLTKTLWGLSPEIFYTAVKSLLVGPVSSSDVTSDKQLPLFNLKANLFSNMWVYDKSLDIERPGSFVYHMYRHVSLLFSFLSHRHSAEALLSTLSLLRLRPDPANTYLREYKRVELFQAGLLTATQALESVCALGLLGAKPLHLLKASFILHSFALKSSLADQLAERLGVMLLKYYQLHKGEGEHSLDKVLSYCAQLTSLSDQLPHAKKLKQLKPKPLPTS